jgi:ribosome biogenesis GTPase / thiamine phosphate phosphatase
VVNKTELGIDDALRAQLERFGKAGYSWIPCSVRGSSGYDGLLEACAGQIAALVGQSGVGKSSIVKWLIPNAEVETGTLVREEEGRHTTTASRMFDLPRGGHLIDSPGVRDFAPAVDRLDSRSLGFVEVERLAPGCRFADCRHMREPGCAVRDATESGAMDARRYESYRRLRRLYEDLMAARGPERRR